MRPQLLIKNVGGEYKVVPVYEKDKKLEFHQMNQNSQIFQDLLDNVTMTRNRARTHCGCEKMLTRMSDIKSALKRIDIEPKEIIVVSSRGTKCKNYKLTARQILKIRGIFKTTNREKS